MKTIGLLGGMSWQSTMSYYQGLNLGVAKRLGGLHCAKIILNSVDFQPLEVLQHQGNWAQIAKDLTTAAQSIERAGADFLLIGTNTMHKVAAQIQNNIDIPILHIADACGAKLKQDGIGCAGLLGTRFTMEQDFYSAKLANNFAINTKIPNEKDRQAVHDIIYQELCHGVIKDESRAIYQQIICKLTKQGCEGIILGCTEIALLLTQKAVKQQDVNIALYDTTQIHIQAALDEALG